MNAASLLQDALQLMEERGGDAADRPGMMWALVEDAADTERRIRDRPDARGYGRSTWPSMLRAQADQESVYRHRVLSGVTLETRVYEPPSARQIARSEAIVSLWKPGRFATLVKGHRRAEIATKALWLYAMGVAPSRMPSELKLPRQTLHSYKERFAAKLAIDLWGE